MHKYFTHTCTVTIIRKYTRTHTQTHTHTLQVSFANSQPQQAPTNAFTQTHTSTHTHTPESVFSLIREILGERETSTHTHAQTDTHTLTQTQLENAVITQTLTHTHTQHDTAWLCLSECVTHTHKYPHHMCALLLCVCLILELEEQIATIKHTVRNKERKRECVYGLMCVLVLVFVHLCVCTEESGGLCESTRSYRHTHNAHANTQLTQTHIDKHTQTSTRTYIHTHTYTHAYARTHPHVNMQGLLLGLPSAPLHGCVSALVTLFETFSHAYPHTHTHTHVHTEREKETLIEREKERERERERVSDEHTQKKKQSVSKSEKRRIVRESLARVCAGECVDVNLWMCWRGACAIIMQVRCTHTHSHNTCVCWGV